MDSIFFILPPKKTYPSEQKHKNNVDKTVMQEINKEFHNAVKKLFFCINSNDKVIIESQEVNKGYNKDIIGI